MKIKHNKMYLSLWEDWKKAGFTNETITKICIEGECETVKQIADYLENNYKMYQYVKNNGIKYGEEDLFFWTNCGETLTYFDITVKANTLVQHNEIVNSIIQYLEANYSNTQLYVDLQYHNLKDWNLINEYLSKDFDIDNLDVDKLRPLYGYLYSGHQLTKENESKLIQLSEDYLKQFENKKVILNDNIRGTIKRITEDSFGLFKPRATRTYYPIDLSKIKSLVLI